MTGRPWHSTAPAAFLINDGQQIYQEIIAYNGDEYRRYLNRSNVWSAWRSYFDDSMHIPTINGGFGANISIDICETEHLERCESFVTEMNRIAKNIGMTNTIVKTPSGYNKKPVNGNKNTVSVDYNSYMTAYDALKLLIAARHTPTVLKAMGTEVYTFTYNYNVKGTVNGTLHSDTWKLWAENNGYTILGIKGGSLTENYGEIGSNGILNNIILVKDSNEDVYGVSILGLQNTNEEKVLQRTLIVDLINMIKGSSVTAAITNASTRTDYPVCMAAAKLTENGSFEDDIEMLSNGVFFNENQTRVSASVVKVLAGIVVVSCLNNQYVSINVDDLVGGSAFRDANNNLVFPAGTVTTTYDALHIMLMISDNHMATLLARVYGRNLR